MVFIDFILLHNHNGDVNDDNLIVVQFLVFDFRIIYSCNLINLLEYLIDVKTEFYS